MNKNVPTGSQTISCNVASCRFNYECKECMLDAIQVCPGPVKADNHSMCNSYRRR